MNSVLIIFSRGQLLYTQFEFNKFFADLRTDWRIAHWLALRALMAHFEFQVLWMRMRTEFYALDGASATGE